MRTTTEKSPGQLDTPDHSQDNCGAEPFEIGFQDLIWGLKYTEDLKNSPGEWNWMIHNCVHAARGAGAAAGVNFNIPFIIYPQQLGVYLKGRWKLCYP